VGYGSDRHHAGQDVSHGQRADRPCVGTQLAHGSLETSRIQQGREEHQEDQVGLQRDVRQARQQPEREPTQDEHDRVRHVQSAGSCGQRSHGRE